MKNDTVLSLKKNLRSNYFEIVKLPKRIRFPKMSSEFVKLWRKNRVQTCINNYIMNLVDFIKSPRKSLKYENKNKLTPYDVVNNANSWNTNVH